MTRGVAISTESIRFDLTSQNSQTTVQLSALSTRIYHFAPPVQEGSVLSRPGQEPFTWRVCFAPS